MHCICSIRLDTDETPSVSGPVWYVCLKTKNCCLKTFVEIRVGEKVRWNTWNVVWKLKIVVWKHKPNTPSASTFSLFSFLKHVYVALCHTSGSRVLFTKLINLFFSNFYIKNKSHDIIYTFKNYFTTIFSAK